MTVRICHIIALILLLSNTCFAQHDYNYNKVWNFGNSLGLDFNSGAPVPFSMTFSLGNNALECSASVCDSAGNLLFYTNGKEIHNRTGNTMPHGDTLVKYETYSTTQCTQVVPVIGEWRKYYVFSLEQINNSIPLLSDKLLT